MTHGSSFLQLCRRIYFFSFFFSFLLDEGLDRGRARCLLASSSNGLMGFETAQRHRDNPEFSFPTL